MIVMFISDWIPRLLLSINDGNEISFNDEHPQKEFFPIEVTDDGIDISANDEHLWKEDLPIEATDDGIEIWVNDVHP